MSVVSAAFLLASLSEAVYALLAFVMPHLLATFHPLQVNKRAKTQERAILVTDTEIFKLDPRKHFQRKKSPLSLAEVEGVSVSPLLDQAFAVHFRSGKDLLCFMLNPRNENRIAELVAVLCQICQR